jgi:hypothetical protein
VCGEARAVLRAGAADFLLNGCQLEVSTDESVRHIPRCDDDYARGSSIGSVLVSQCWMWMLCPELDAISPDWFEDGFVQKGFVA